MNNGYYEALQQRRTHYAISAQSPISDEQIIERIEYAVKHTPSAFNSQSSCVAILFGENHKTLWSKALDILRGIVPPEAFSSTEEKIQSFTAGHGSVLFFDDTTVTAGLMQAYPLYKDNFPIWAQQANGMLQHAVWTSLTLEGLGASLQHYNPLIDDAVKEAFGIPLQWKLIAQMPFGTPTAPPAPKEFLPAQDRVRILR